MSPVLRTLSRALPPKQRRAIFDGFARLMSGRVVKKDLGGYRAELHLSEVMEMAAWLGRFENDAKQVIDTYVKQGMTVLDIGANVGLHALRLARNVGGAGVVYAFEPTEFAFKKLQRNIELNPDLRIKPFRLALTNEAREAVEVDFRSSWTTDGRRDDPTKTTVDCAVLDDWLSAHQISQVDFIKLDVDGYEGMVLEGSARMLADLRPTILIEAWVGQFGKGQPDPFVILEKAGYRFKLTVGNNDSITAAGILPRLEHLFANGAESFNVLALPSDR